MTNVTFLYDNNIVNGLHISGHACFNLKGPDIVCAALSAASFMTVNGILDWTGLNADDVIKIHDDKTGTLLFEVPYPFYENVTVQQLFKSFELFVTDLEEEYPENVKVMKGEQSDK